MAVIPGAYTYGWTYHILDQLDLDCAEKIAELWYDPVRLRKILLIIIIMIMIKE